MVVFWNTPRFLAFLAQKTFFESFSKCHHVKERKKLNTLGMFVFFPRFLKVEYDLVENIQFLDFVFGSFTYQFLTPSQFSQKKFRHQNSTQSSSIYVFSICVSCFDMPCRNWVLLTNFGRINAFFLSNISKKATQFWEFLNVEAR